MLPDYLAKAVPNPPVKRGPWYANTAPSYAGIFLWVAFYKAMAGATLAHAGLALCLAALLIAGVLCYAFYYRVPAMLGMQTGYPLYVVGSSTFGVVGGYVMPGLLMGLLQIGWFAVATFVATDFLLKGVGMNSEPGTAPFIVTGLIWGLVLSWVGAKGIQYVAKIATFLNFIPLLMLLIVVFQTAGGVGKYQAPPGQENSYMAFTTMIAIVIGFFATAGAAGADFGTNSRNETDVKWGGLVGITLAVLIAGGLPLISVAGAHGMNPTLGWDYADVIQGIGGPIASVMFILFAVASVPPTCFCAFIAGNSFNTMIPSVPRVASTMAGAAVGIVLAVTGVAANLIQFFTIVGASFGPICGAMAADYVLSGRRWPGPREGVNWAGYGAWAVGFLVGILPFLPLPADVKPYLEPAVLYSFIVGFLVYMLLAKAGLQPQVVAMPKAKAA
ncbi:MAG TPA: cytosine permease [Bryobacteraceae bacterium]|jgi:cytosine permease|nr:cytosine permease [Bryobacteraceae bacterium]